jgi:hypothetical protein
MTHEVAEDGTKGVTKLSVWKVRIKGEFKRGFAPS